MPTIGVKQLSFAGGELTPAASPRVDLTKYATGAGTMRNVFVARHGAAYNRPGTQFVAEAKDSSKALILHAFDFNDDNAYIIGFEEQLIRIYIDGAQLITGSVADWAAQAYTVGDLVKDGAAGTGSNKHFYCLADHAGIDGVNGPQDMPQSGGGGGSIIDVNVFWDELKLHSDATNFILELLTPYAEADLADIRVTQSADIMTVTHKNYPPYELIRSGVVAWTFLPIRFAPNVAAPAGITNDGGEGVKAGNNDKSPVYIITAIKKGTSEESLPGAIDQLADSGGDDGNIAAQGITTDISVANTGHSLLTGDEIIITSVTVQSATETNQVAVEMLVNRTFSVTRVDGDIFTLDDTAGLLALPGWYPNSWPALNVGYRRSMWLAEHTDGNAFKVPTSASTTEIELSWTAVPDAEEYWVYRASTPEIPSSGGGAQPLTPEEAGAFGFIGSTKIPSYADDGKVEPDTEQPPPRHPPPFVLNDWPAVSSYYQQRQIFAASNDNPRRVWMSRTGDFRNFTKRVPLNDDDSIEFDAQGERVNEVRHVIDIGTLLVLTRGAVQIAVGDTNGVITPDSINLRWQAPYGAGTAKPAAIGDSVLYVDTRRSIIRDVGYTIERDKYNAGDQTAFAAHLFDGHTLVQIAFAGTPHPILWCVRDDGVLLGLTFSREQQINAWHQHVTKTNAGGSTDTASVIESCAVIPENDVDTLYLVVKRMINSSPVRYIERFQPRRAGYSDYDYRVDPWFLDSALGYDGTNLLSDGATVDATTLLKLTHTGTPTWAKDHTGYTITSSVGTAAFPNDTTNIGNGYRLALADGTYCEVEITAHTSTTVETCKLLTDVPAGALRTSTTALWVRMVDSFTGADHLEGETLVLCADGVEVATAAAVSSGAFAPTDGRPYGIVRAGLKIIADLETLDLDIANQLDSVADKEKRVAGATLYLEDTEGIQVAAVTENGANTLYPLQRSNVDGLDQIDTTTGLAAVTPINGKRRARVTTTWGQMGRLRIRQTAPLPMAILGLVTDVEIRGRKP